MEVQANKTYMELLFEHTPESLILLGSSDEIIECNQTFLNMFDFQDRNQVIAQPLSIIHSSEENCRSFLKKVHHALHVNKPLTIELDFSRQTGSSIPCEVNLEAIRDENGIVTYRVVTIKDITHWKRREQELAHRATHDPLTDFPNRLLFYDRLALALVHAQRNRERLAVLFIDIDSFKDINYQFGYSVGDLLLKEAGKRVTKCLRKGDTVGRFGDDEYVVLLPGIMRKENVSFVTDKILKMLSSPYALGGYEFSISASIGISIFPEDGDVLEDLVKNADIAMSYVKKMGRNRFQFYSAVTT